MLTFAAWHWLALASVVFAGLFSFVLKVGAERTHSSALLNAVASCVSLVFAVGGMWWLGESLTPNLLLLAGINGIMYIFGTIARSDALAHIDATLFFPIYKIVGPLLVLICSLAFLGERLTFLQGIGFILAVGVPLLLLDRVEGIRQKNFRMGVWLTVAAAVLISGGQVLAKVALDAGAGAFAFSVLAYGITVVGISVPYVARHRSEVLSISHWHDVLGIGALAGLLQFAGYVTLLYAFKTGPIATSYAINSTYILIPIVLSIWYYGEHWNARKMIAIALSIGAVVLLR